MKHYHTEDFNGENVLAETLEDAIEKKVSLLKDFAFLTEQDDREDVIKNILGTCKSERELDIMLHDVVRFNETIDEFITRKEKENAVHN